MLGGILVRVSDMPSMPTVSVAAFVSGMALIVAALVGKDVAQNEYYGDNASSF